MLVYNLKSNIYLMEPDDPLEPEFACKLFVSKLSIDELQNVYVNKSNINNFNDAYFQKIINSKLDFKMQIVFDNFDNIKYPIILMFFPLNKTLGDNENYNLWLDHIDSLIIDNPEIKPIKKQNIEMVFNYLTKYFNEEILFFK